MSIGPKVGAGALVALTAAAAVAVATGRTAAPGDTTATITAPTIVTPAPTPSRHVATTTTTRPTPKPAPPRPYLLPSIRGVSKATALARLAALPVRERTGRPGYDRNQWLRGWPSVQGCSVRNRVLAAQLRDVTRSESCAVLAGTRTSPYTLATVTYSSSASSSVQIDHVYPLRAAYDANMPRTKWRAFAIDEAANLYAVEGRVNASKGDSTPAEWMPINPCPFSKAYVEVARKWGLPITAADKTALREAIVAKC